MIFHEGEAAGSGGRGESIASHCIASISHVLSDSAYVPRPLFVTNPNPIQAPGAAGK